MSVVSHPQADKIFTNKIPDVGQIITVTIKPPLKLAWTKNSGSDHMLVHEAMSQHDRECWMVLVGVTECLKGGGGGIMIKPPYLPPWAPQKLNIFLPYMYIVLVTCGVEVHLQGKLLGVEGVTSTSL